MLFRSNGVITKADLKRIPEGYVLVNENERAVNKDTKTIEIAVEKEIQNKTSNIHTFKKTIITVIIIKTVITIVMLASVTCWL